MRLPRTFDSYWLAVALVSIFAIAPFFAGGYFWTAHDARHSVYFLVEFDRGIRDGVLYPRWQPEFNFGYGYPFFNIYSPGVFFVAEGLHLLGLDFVTAVKVMFAVGLLLSGLAMYLYARRLLASRAGALLAATLYIYLPYHLADVFLRGHVSESFVFVFFPLVLWAFYNLLLAPSARHALAAGLAVFGLVFTHHGLALLFIPFLGLYVLALILYRQRTTGGTWRDSLRLLAWSAAAGAYGLALAGILLLPLALEYRYVRTDQWAGGYYSYGDHFVYPFQFFAPTWGYGPGSVAGPNDTLPFQLGAVPVALGVLSLPAWAWLRGKREPGLRLVVVFYQAATVALMLLMMDVSRPLWDALHLVAFTQFPWRLLALTGLALSVLGGLVVALDERRREQAASPILLAALLALAVLGSYNYLQPALAEPPEGPVSLGGLMRFEQSSGELTGMTAWATRPKPPSWSPLAQVFAQGGEVTDKVMRETLEAGVQAITVRHSSVLDEVRVSTARDTAIAFHTAYYPGWRAYVDGKETTISTVGDLGAMSVQVPAGQHTLLLQFGDTLPRQAGALLSLVSLVAGVVVFARGRRP